MRSGTITRHLLRGLFAAGLLCTLWPGMVHAAPPALKRGINLSYWFANTPRQPLGDADFKQIKAAGFDHVRIPVNPELFGFSLLEAAGGRVLMDYSTIDQAVGLSVSNGLPVVLDLHPGPGLMNILEENPQGEEGFIQLWKKIAEHFKMYTESVIVFELLNEPEYNETPQQYTFLISDLLSELRSSMPNYLFIVDAPHGGTIDGLADLKPVPDENVIYAFHFYEPRIVTYQGWNQPLPERAVRSFRNVPYPSRLVDRNVNYAPMASDAAEAKKELEEYVAGGWDYDHIAARIRIAADWAQAHHVRIICTEFGALRTHIDPAARYRWITDTRKALDQNGIPWDLWDYTDLFGIVKLVGKTRVEQTDGSTTLADPAEGTRIFEYEAMKALFPATPAK